MATLCSYEYVHRTCAAFNDDEVLVPVDEDHDSTDCKYCGEALDRRSNRILPEADLYEEQYRLTKSRPLTNDTYDLLVCTACGWWKIRQDKYTSDLPSGKYLLKGIARQYEISSVDAPIEALRLFLGRHPNHMAHVNPSRFEVLMRDCLRSEFAPCEVIHCGKTGDGGVDLRLIMADDTTWLVQVKRRNNLAHPEGVRVVRELNGVLFREGRAKGMVISTATSFTKGATMETQTRTPTAEPYVVKLFAFDDIVRMLRLPRVDPYEPWRGFAEQFKDELVSFDVVYP
jgi:hypothetical protein